MHHLHLFLYDLSLIHSLSFPFPIFSLSLEKKFSPHNHKSPPLLETTMPFFFIFFCFLLSPATTTTTFTHSRRILHQPFFPLDSLPPSQPPSPSPPSPVPSKLPFSTSTPNQSPFFPTYPSPPPPPSPASFASFPANISSLILPHSTKPKPTSHKLLAVTIAAVVSALVLVAFLLVYYCRRRWARGFADDKSFGSDNTNGYVRNYAETRDGNGHKLRNNSTANSEFLYLGTLVNSRNGLDDSSNAAAVAAVHNSNGGGLDTRKLDSPELRPLPPLGRESFRQNGGNGEVASTTGDDDEEVFYSPRGSSGGRESSSGTGSGSRRVLAAVADDGFGRRSSDSSSCSCSSSSLGSPARSQSISISTPVSLSPQRVDPKSPESSTVHASPPPPPPLALPLTLPSHAMPVGLERSSPSQSLNSSSPRVSNVSDRNFRSPSLSSSPERNSDVLPGMVSNVSDRNVRSPSLSSSPERNSDVLPGMVDVSDKNMVSHSLSSATTSPNRGSEKSPSPSPRISSVLSYNVRSPSLSPARLSTVLDQYGPSHAHFSASTSPERRFGENPAGFLGNLTELDGTVHTSLLSSQSTSPSTSPPRNLEISLCASLPTSTVSNQDIGSPSLSSASTSPARSFKKSPDVSPRLSNASDQNADTINGAGQPLSVPVPVPPSPPPPPPPPPPRRFWELPVASTPTGQAISRPPALIPPARPFVLQSLTKVSPMELPPSSRTLENVEEEIPKPKLKPLHWDKVRASSDREMVWDQLRSSSFKLNEEMIETLFVVNTPDTKQKQATPRMVLPSPNQEDRVLDPKKSQNIAILLRALNVTIEEVCDALLEGNADTLGTELLESLLKMTPTKEEERKLKEYNEDSPIKLGPAEKFLKALLDIPFAFKRVDAMLYIANFESEVEYLKRSFETLEVACEELRNSRMFLKLLEAVLKTGNRMNVGTNRGDAHAFKLDTLLKLVDVKGADGKTTLLHFVVQEIIRTEGARLSSANQTPNSCSSEDAKCRKLGLQVVSGLSSELANVKKAAAMDSDVLSGDVSKLSRGIEHISEVVRQNETTGLDECGQKFSECMNKFMKSAEEEIIRIRAQESVALSLVKEITEYFHGDSAREEAHPFRIFLVVRDFLTILDRVCKEVGTINERTVVSTAHKFPVPVNPTLPQVLGAHGRRQYGSSDDESSSS